MRTLSALLSFLFATTLFAQTPSVVTVRDTSDNVVNGSTIIVYGNSSTMLMDKSLSTELNGSVAKTINMRRHELNVVTGSKNYFCWGLCYLPRLSGNTPRMSSK